MYLDDLVFLCPLETGGYSTVWKVKYKGKKYALKMISKQNLNSKIKRKALKTEIQIHKQLKHQNIINMEASFDDDFFSYILLELGDDDLFNRFNEGTDFEEKEIINIAQQLINALCYLKSKNIIHMDLKMENILFVGNNVKICDFGLACQGWYHYTMVGTFEYMSPEIINGDIYSFKTDIWSLGIILYFLVHGDPPFTVYQHGIRTNTIDKCKTEIAIRTKTIDFPKPHVMNDLIAQCLEKNQHQRISIDELINHKIFEKSNSLKY